MKTLPDIFIINLARSTERRRKMAEQLSRMKLPHVFYDAVDGRALSSKQQACYSGTLRRLFFGHDMTAGEIGCLLSHRQVYRHMIDNDIPVALILEDDAILSDDFPTLLRSLMSSSFKWDVIRFLSRQKVYQHSRRIGHLYRQYDLGRAQGTPGGAYAYLLTLQAAKSFNRHMRKNWIPVDTLHGQIWRTLLIGTYNILPSPVSYNDGVESTIEAKRFDKSGELSAWERGLFPLTRFGRKLYELLGKNLIRLSTWPHDMVIARQLHNKKRLER